MSAPILYCHCAYAKVVPKETKEAVLAGLNESGAAFEAVPDLCEMAARKDPALARFSTCGQLKIAACYPRAVKWLFHGAGFALPEDEIQVVNMREEEAADVLDTVLDPTLEANLATPGPEHGNGSAEEASSETTTETSETP